VSDGTMGLALSDAWAEAEAELANSPDLDDATSEESAPPKPKEDEQPNTTEGLFDSLNHDGQQEENILQIGDSTNVDINGTSVPLAELKNGYLRQSDYTQKTQELAALRKEATDALTLWKALQADPQGTLRRLNSKAGIQGISTGTLGGYQPPKHTTTGWGDDSANAIDELVKKTVDEKLAADPRIRAFENDYTRQLLDSEFAKIEASYGVTLSPKDRLVVLKKADELKVSDLAFVFSGLMGEVDRRKAMKANIAKTSTKSGRTLSDKDNKPEAKKVPEDFWEAVQQAMDEEGIDDLSRAF